MDVKELPRLARVRALVRSGAALDTRVRAGISRTEIADALGVSPATVWRWEHGQRVPRGEPALRYAELLDRLSA